MGKMSFLDFLFHLANWKSTSRSFESQVPAFSRVHYGETLGRFEIFIQVALVALGLWIYKFVASI